MHLRATTGIAAVFFLVGLCVYQFPVLALALGAVWTWFIWRNIQGMLDDVQARFTKPVEA
jgi:hypothetical protein